jgi:HD superfamily phosphohydrolase
MLPVRYQTKTGRLAYGVAYDENDVELIEHAVSGRIRMYENCYESEIKVASETMLTNAVRDFLGNHKSIDVRDLLLLTDDELIAIILGSSPPASPEFRLTDLLVKQKYFKRVDTIFLTPSRRGYKSAQCDSYLDAMTKQKEFLSDQFDIPLKWQEKISVGMQPDRKWMIETYATPYDRFELKEQELRLIRERGDRFEFVTLAKSEKAKDMVSLLAERVRNYPRIEIFADDEIQKEDLDEVRRVSKVLFES